MTKSDDEESPTCSESAKKDDELDPFQYTVVPSLKLEGTVNV